MVCKNFFPLWPNLCPSLYLFTKHLESGWSRTSLYKSSHFCCRQIPRFSWPASGQGLHSLHAFYLDFSFLRLSNCSPNSYDKTKQKKTAQHNFLQVCLVAMSWILFVMRIWKGIRQLLVSALLYKKLGSHHSHLYNKKNSEQTENQQFLLDPTENWGHKTNHHFKI